MNYLRCITLAMALSFGIMACVAPADAAGAATTDKKNTNSYKTTKTPTAHASKVKKKPAQKKTEVKASSKSSKATVARATTKKKSHSVKKAKRTNRQVWMDRAKGSEMLMGEASWYGKDFHGGKTASGLDYDMYTFTAAHKTLPLGTVVKVTDEITGRSVMVCINNRGPFSPGRVIDLSYAAAKQIGLNERGVAPVSLEVVSNAEGKPLKEDEAFYVKLLSDESGKEENVGPFVQYADASVMQEVLRNQHPNAAIVLGSNETRIN